MAGPPGGPIDVDIDVPMFDEAPPIPYNRSGTQIFEDPRNKTDDEGEGVDDNDIEITEELLEQMWDEYDRDPNFFKEIEIAKDGGFSEVDELIGGMRYFTAGLLVFFVFLNAYSLTSINVGLILEATSGSNETEPIFLITKQYLIRNVSLNDKSSNPVERVTARILANDKAVLGTLELGMFIVYVLKMICNGIQIRCAKSEMGRWQGVQELCWNSVPEAATISAVKLLNYVTPAVVLPSLSLTLAWGPESTWCGQIINLIVFLIIRIIAGIIGFDAFLFKLQTVSQQIGEHMSTAQAGTGTEGVYSGYDVMLISAAALAFLNQMLGIVQLGWFVRKRIFAFIFAGEDGHLSPEEDALKEVWESMLAQRIWTDLPKHQAIAAYLSYSDFDFQKLALETVKPGHEAKSPSARKAAREAKKGEHVELVSAS